MRIGKREYLNDADARDLMRALNQYFENMVKIPRIRIGKRICSMQMLQSI